MLKNSRIDFTFGCTVIPSIMILFGYTEILLPLILAVIIHEAGHYLAVTAMGGSIENITFNAGGLKMLYNSGSFTYMQDTLCVLAGPFAGIIAAYITSHCGFLVFSGINLSISLFNLLPIRPLDGGKILFNLFSIFFDFRAVYIIRYIEALFLILLTVLSVYVYVITNGNAALCLLTTVLFFYYCKEL